MSIQILNKPFARSVTSLRQLGIFKRFKSRLQCASHDDPICSAENLKKKKSCAAKQHQTAGKEKQTELKSMWYNPECCKDPCPDFYPRFDELYYESSDKLKRKYQQTWVSCPELQMRQEKICSHEHLQFAPMEKRQRKKIPKTACPIGGPRVCMDKRSRKCPRVIIPNCRGARQPPKCKRERSISHCLKECAPYPSFSECLRNQTDEPAAIECKCLNHPMMCDVWAEMRRRMTFVKGSKAFD